MGTAGPHAGRGAVRLAAVCAAAVLAACGARSPLAVGAAPRATSSGGSAGSPAVDDAGADHRDAAPGCSLDDLSTWRIERYRDHGDYERAAVALDGVPWVALKVKGGNIVLEKLDVGAGGMVVQRRIEVPNSPVYPVGLDVDARRFVMLTTTGINWNGTVELWRIDRAGGRTLRVPVGNPSTDPAYTISSAIGLAGDDIALAYQRVADGRGTIELRNDALGIITSRTVTGSSFTGVRSGNAVDIYVGKTACIHAEDGVLQSKPVDPDWQVIGGLDGFLVERGRKIRLTDGVQAWAADWPHSQLAPPAVVRTDGTRAVFSLETELTAVVGHVAGGRLSWLRIESAPGAPGTGQGLMPVVERGRLGLFYLGLEIPSPEQPLRYYGLACP